MYLRDIPVVMQHLGFANTCKLVLSRRKLSKALPAWTRSLYLSSDGAGLHFRHGTSDKYVIAEVLGKRQYACTDGLPDVRVVIDAGANIGTASRHFLNAFPQARVIAIEPDPGNFEILSANLAPFSARAIAMHAALVDTPGRVDVQRGRFRDGAEWSTQVVPGDACDGVSVAGVMANLGLDSIDLLKIDIEGYEKQVFSARDLTWLRSVRAIAIELHDDEARRIFRDATDPYGGTTSRFGELTLWVRE